MNTTLHLFRHDVRRLRWWLLAWAAFLVGTHAWAHLGVWAVQSTTSQDWLRNFLHPETAVILVWLAAQVTLAALLLLPHGPDDPRLFWRTRPIAPWDMVRAKLLFAGAFLVAMPMLVETVFWLAWLSAGETVTFWPKMLLKLASLSALLFVVITLAGREGKRYGFCVLGLLLAFGGWVQVGEQLAMRAAAGTEFESWPAMESTHLLGQVWEFWTKNQAGRMISMSSRTAVVPVYVLALAGWLVVACRYVWAGWRATRLVVEAAVLLALVVAFMREKPWAVSEARVRVDAHETQLAMAMASAQVNLKSARLVSAQRFAQVTRRKPGTNELALAEVEWHVTGAPSESVTLVRLRSFAAAERPQEQFYLRDFPTWMLSNREVGYSVSVESNQLVQALPALRGYQLNVELLPHWHWFHVAEEMRSLLRPQPTGELLATVNVAAIRPEVMAVLPLREWTNTRVGGAKIRVEGVPAYNLDIQEPSDPLHRFLSDPTLKLEAPNLFLLRNPRTKQAVALNWTSMPTPEVRVEFGGVSVGLRYSSQHMSFARRICHLEKAVARHGFDAAWLEESELLCVRLKLIGSAQREVALENFRLDPAPAR